ncbi:S-adenosyl-L-methionine-dependent methyltransferases superfamily protein [Rhynchospora pubera]|uniref:S-adenosyl-L-methionine-dependent methyltransferases superfamily protein n=1 Tax=Rhynchospora pubera TaxID=906938 RepID=A0AAV8CJT3_9POAL|nr:S-adenosyl-L-methionine-dependent methyltransferases superfamily protein [Rhynchospora pubera]
MDRNVRRLLNRVSVVFATIATICLLNLFHHSSRTCFSSSLTHTHLTLSRAPFPKSSCDAFSRRVSSIEARSAKFRSSRSFLRRVHSLSVSVFDPIRSLHLLSNSSNVLCVLAGIGHAVDSLQESGVTDVTGVDVIDYPPLVQRADPHNLPFFDGVFDLGFSDGLVGALYPIRFVGELERTVRRGGAVVLVVAREVANVEEVVGLFKRSKLLEVRSVNLDGSDMNLIVMKRNGTKSS